MNKVEAHNDSTSLSLPKKVMDPTDSTSLSLSQRVGTPYKKDLCIPHFITFLIEYDGVLPNLFLVNLLCFISSLQLPSGFNGATSDQT